MGSYDSHIANQDWGRAVRIGGVQDASARINGTCDFLVSVMQGWRLALAGNFSSVRMTNITAYSPC